MSSDTSDAAVGDPSAGEWFAAPDAPSTSWGGTWGDAAPAPARRTSLDVTAAGAYLCSICGTYQAWIWPADSSTVEKGCCQQSECIHYDEAWGAAIRKPHERRLRLTASTTVVLGDRLNCTLAVNLGPEGGTIACRPRHPNLGTPAVQVSIVYPFHVEVGSLAGSTASGSQDVINVGSQIYKQCESAIIDFQFRIDLEDKSAHAFSRAFVI